MSEGLNVEVRWKMVTCTGCGRTYQCTPRDDWYDGLCTACLLATKFAARRRLALQPALDAFSVLHTFHLHHEQALKFDEAASIRRAITILSTFIEGAL